MKDMCQSGDWVRNHVCLMSILPPWLFNEHSATHLLYQGNLLLQSTWGRPWCARVNFRTQKSTMAWSFLWRVCKFCCNVLFTQLGTWDMAMGPGCNSILWWNWKIRMKRLKQPARKNWGPSHWGSKPISIMSVDMWVAMGCQSGITYHEWIWMVAS